MILAWLNQYREMHYAVKNLNLSSNVAYTHSLSWTLCSWQMEIATFGVPTGHMCIRDAYILPTMLRFATSKTM